VELSNYAEEIGCPAPGQAWEKWLSLISRQLAFEQDGNLQKGGVPAAVFENLLPDQ